MGLICPVKRDSNLINLALNVPIYEVYQHLGKMSKILLFYYYLPLFLTIRHHLFYVALSDDEGLYYSCCLGCE